jgi:hypothetical protein
MSAECPSKKALLKQDFFGRQESMEPDFSTLDQRVRQLSAEIALLKAQQNKGLGQSSPWLPLKDAASRLNFRSPRILRNRIKNGQFPPDCFRVDPTASGNAPKYLIHVERYIKQLR